MFEAPRNFGWLIIGGEGYGVGNSTVAMAQELQKRNVMPHFVSVGPGSLVDRLIDADFDVRVCYDIAPGFMDSLSAYLLSRIYSIASNSLACSKRISDAIRELKESDAIDWLHFRSNYFVPMATAISFRHRLTSFWHLPGDIRKTPFNLLSHSYRAACRIGRIVPLGNSEFTSNSLRVDTKNVVYPGVDESLFIRPSTPFELPNNFQAPDSVVFGIIASLGKNKDQLTIVEALSHLVSEGINANLLIVGGPLGSEYAKKLQSRISELKLEQRVLLTGPTTDPLPYFLASDIVINSRANAEPFGRSIVEAMLCERPVLALPLGGPAESVLEKETGWFVTGTSINDWAHGMRNAINDQAKWKSMGKNGRTRAIELFTAAAAAEKYITIVKNNLFAGR